MKLYNLSLENNKGRWRDIEGYPNYEISESGVIRTKSNGQLRKTKLDKDGYEEVVLFKDGKRYYLKVHRLVASAYLEVREGAYEVNHIDRNRTNNNIENLEYMTREENLRYMHEGRKLNVSSEDQMRNFNVGDKVKWNNEQVGIYGTIRKIHKEDFTYRGNKYYASEGRPQVLLELSKGNGFMTCSPYVLTKWNTESSNI